MKNSIFALDNINHEQLIYLQILRTHLSPKKKKQNKDVK